MFKNLWLAFASVVVLCSANAGVVPFITPCKSEDKACIIKSSQEALPKIVAGIPELGLETADPLKIDEAIGDNGDLKLKFTEVTVTGASKCEVLNVERNLENSSLLFEVACPLTVEGKYEVGGKVLLIPVEGKDKFKIYSDKVKISIEVVLKIEDRKDEKKYWSFASWTHSYQLLEKVHFKFDNLLNGAISEPLEKLLDEQWKELAEEVGKPIVEVFIEKAVQIAGTFIAAVPANELEVI